MSEDERLRAKCATRKRDGRCVCCGFSFVEEKRDCGCSYCAVCLDRGHDAHDAEWGPPCIDLSAPGLTFLDE